MKQLGEKEIQQPMEPQGEWTHVQGKLNTLNTETDETPIVHITTEDVSNELEYWKQAIYGFVLGANPPMAILEGYIRRIWHKHTIDKISFMPNGVFLVRFQTKEMQEQVLKAGHYLFDSKPVIIKPWKEDISLEREEVKSVPTWVRLHRLPLKFWGQSLPKLAGAIGSHIQNDAGTDTKTRLGYARVMVEVQVNQKFPKTIKVVDEKQQLTEIEIEYEWKPVTCKGCKRLGHEEEQCRTTHGK
ncbi:uncharacterized protein LOC141630092 [Silene latifolia]|uniref:uncharacterized protein LOC141630092 n=1 Tax=Silene latifolia TaxID=37657 RepID=UPI003D76B722